MPSRWANNWRSSFSISNWTVQLLLETMPWPQTSTVAAGAEKEAAPVAHQPFASTRCDLLLASCTTNWSATQPASFTAVINHPFPNPLIHSSLYGTICTLNVCSSSIISLKLKSTFIFGRHYKTVPPIRLSFSCRQRENLFDFFDFFSKLPKSTNSVNSSECRTTKVNVWTCTSRESGKFCTRIRRNMRY